MQKQRLTLKEMGLHHAKHNDAKLNFVEKFKFESNTDINIRLHGNKKALDRIFNDIVSVANQIRFSKDKEEKRKLEVEFRRLSNKYCYSNGIDETISHNG